MEPVQIDQGYETDPTSSGSWVTAEGEEEEGEDTMEGTSGNSAAPIDGAARDRGKGQHGCQHYRRRCKLVAPCCGESFWCASLHVNNGVLLRLDP